MKTPRSIRVSRFLGELTGRAQAAVDSLLGAADDLCSRLGLPHTVAARATLALARLSRVLSYSVLSYDLSGLPDEHLRTLQRDLQNGQGNAVALNFLLQDFVALVAEWEGPAVSALLLTLIFNLLLHEDVDADEAMALILNSILASQGRGEELAEYLHWYCETLALGYEEFLVYVVLEAALAGDAEGSPPQQSPPFAATY